MLKFLVLVGLTCSVSLSIAQTNVFPPSGNVGIGTLNPENADGWDKVLEIYGTNYSKMLVSTATVKSGFWSHDIGYYGSPAGAILGTLSNHPFSIVTNRSPKVTITSNGSVGVGTTNPTDLLEIKTGGARRGITLVGDGGLDAYNDFQFAIDNKSSILAGKPQRWIISHRKDGYFSDTPIGEASLEFYGERAGGGFLAPLSFKSNGDVILASNKNALNGNVGIGTTTPREKLSVNGNIRAKEVKVETKDWPDYVFKKDYKMISLPELKEFIRINEHLPEMPKASDAEINGVELGKLNKLLLKKVEELTLLLINQYENAEIQGEKLKQLSSEMKALKETIRK